MENGSSVEGRSINGQLIFAEIPTLARGGKFGEVKAWKSWAFVFVALGEYGSQKRGRDKSRGGAIPVPSEELVVEEQTDLWDHVVPRHDETSQKIIRSIVLELRHRSLRARQDDGLPQVANHKAQGRASISQAVRPM